MANPTHVKLMMKGAEHLASWRRRNQDVRLDFSNVVLRRVDISHTDLSHADLAKNSDLPMEFLRGCGLYAAYRAVVHRVVVASPGDVSAERRLTRDVIYEWNDHNAHREGAVLLPVLWETHAVPELGDRSQAIINRQLIESSQLLVCIFWSRIGTPAGEADSGTLEEINRFIAAGKPVMVYFCKRPLPQDHDEKQWQRLKKFKNGIKKNGLVYEFENEVELAKMLTQHLSLKLTTLHDLNTVVPIKEGLL